MTGAVAGYKATFNASSSVGGTKTRVAELQDISWSDKQTTFDATSHDGDGARERIGGITDFEAAVAGLYIDDNASHAALFDALSNRAKIDVQLLPAGTSGVDIWGQSGFVSKWSIGGPVDGPARFSASIVGTGGASRLFPFTAALDTFTNSDRNLSAHTPDLGFDGWTYSGAADEWTIKSNKANKTVTNNDIQFCRSNSDIADDGFEVYADYTRSSGGAFQDERSGLYLLAHKSTAIANGEGVTVVFHQNGAGAVYRILVTRRDSSGAEQQNVLVAVGIVITAGQSLRLGATVSGLDVQAWTEPAGGGVRTNRGPVVTLTVDLRDGDHKRIGLTGRSESSAPRSDQDNLTVILNAA